MIASESPSAPRVVSLIASATEWVAALGARPWLVGRSHECDFPPDVLDLPACSSAKFDVHGDSRQIDERVKATLAEATSVYRVHVEQLDALQPTVILTQTQCEVCAVSLRDVEDAVRRSIASRPSVVALAPNALCDVWRDGERIGQALGLSARATALTEALQHRLQALSARCQALRRLPPRVACLEWLEPLMAAGNWIPELVELVGGVSLFGAAGQHSPWMTWDSLVAADPDVIVALPCGYDLAKTTAEMRWLTERADWSTLRAVRDGRVFVTDGNQFFNRPGPRLVESAEMLAEMFYPGAIDGDRRGIGWRPFES